MDILTFKIFLPEIFFSLIILFQLLYNIKIINKFTYNYPIIVKEVTSQVFLIIIFVLLLLYNLKIEGFFANFLFSNDETTRLLKFFLLFFSLLILKVITQSFYIQKLNFFEFFSLYLLSILSLMLLICADDLISVYLVVELQALCFYIFASFKRNSAFSSEAGLKYFIIGSLISGFLLFGISLIYGTTGCLSLNNLNLLMSFEITVENAYFKSVLMFGFLCVFFTFLFKLACAPFHFWAPDVYEGAPLSSTIIFSILPKIAIFSFLIKFLSSIGFIFLEFQTAFLFLGAFSMLIGTLFAISQKRVKRLVIFSSIAQIGLIVVAVCLNSLNGFMASYFYLFNYLISSVAVWSLIVHTYSSNYYINFFYFRDITILFLTSISQFFNNNKLFALFFVILFFSIAGIPPLLGFLAKILILVELARSNYMFMLIFLLIISAVSVFYYIRIVKVVFFEPNTKKEKIKNFQPIFFNKNLDTINVLITFSSLILVVFFYYSSIINLIAQYFALNSFYF